MNNIGIIFDSILDDITSGLYSRFEKELINPNKEELFYNKDEINEICCVYTKDQDSISLVYDYSKYQGDTFPENIYNDRIKSFNEAKSLINSDNIDLFINQRKIKFKFKYISHEGGNLKVKFKFKKLLTSTNQMFYNCYSLKSIDLSLLNISNVNDMSYMLYHCHSLESFNLTSKRTNRIKYMNCMFYNCQNLKTVYFKLYKTSYLENLNHMFVNCSSLETLDLSSFRENSISSMYSTFYDCSSLKVLDLSSIDSNNLLDIEHIFHNCISLKKENVKLHKNAKKLKDKLDSCTIY